MTKSKIVKLIKQGESQRLEFKPSLSDINRITETICSFANAQGGVVIIGINDTGDIEGIDIGKQTVERLTNSLVDNLDPKVYPEIKVLTIDKKEIIIIEVKESSDKPHLASGKAFIRVGKTTKAMSRSEYEKHLLSKRKIKFDSDICKEATLKDIDKENVQWFLSKAKEARNLSITANTSLKESLTKLKLMKKGRITNAAFLMFSKNPQSFFLQCETKCARFKGTSTKEFIDMAEFSGPLFKQVDEAENFVLRNIKKAAWIEPGKIERQEKWEYPKDAIREAITNAIIHRDYEDVAKVQVRIFDDRIEVWNPGSLPEGWTVEDLKHKHESRPFNPVLARLFFLIKYIEEWGRGTLDIIESCLNHGLPEPEFNELTSSIVVTFRKSKITDEMLESLNNRQKELLNYLMTHRKITVSEYRKMFTIAKDTAHRDLTVLIDKGLLIPRGSGRNTYYEFSFGNRTEIGRKSDEKKT